MANILLTDILGGIFAAVGTGYYVGAALDISHANKVRHAEYVDIKDVSKRLAESGQSSIFVKMYGRVASENSLACELAKETTGAILERSRLGVWYTFDAFLNHNYTIWNNYRTSNLYIFPPEEKLLPSPTSKVYVQPWPNNPELTVVHEHLEDGKNYILSLLFGFFGIRYPYKYIERESVLPLGSSLFLMGKVYRDRDGTIHMKKPSPGAFFSPYGVITQKSEEELIDSLREDARNKAVTGTLFNVAGTAIWALGYFGREQ